MKDLSVPMARVQVLVLPFIAASSLLLIPYGLIWGWEGIASGFSQFFELIYFIPTMLLGIIVHEGLHGLGWKYVGKLRWKDMAYGIQWKSLTPYAHSKKPMLKSAYVMGSLLPGIILGLLPYLAALAIGHNWLVIFGVVFTFSAGGDFWVVYTLRNISEKALVQDHPKNAGCIVFDSEDQELPVIFHS
uniref:DUF3267 domain-containing protein n=1 Tax=Roseihalotalea indica TaxID=2867963 RepID=A0AA49GP99_9BACT|nr:DUF3267 domain-containing protein [Tunicatimonas sp. TK19036]